MMEIKGISSISYGIISEPHEHLPIINNPILSNSFSPETTLDLSFTITDFDEKYKQLFGEWISEPRFDVTIKTKRTPRKLKKAKKKAGTFYSKRTTHLHDMVMRKELVCI